MKYLAILLFLSVNVFADNIHTPVFSYDGSSNTPTTPGTDVSGYFFDGQTYKILRIPVPNTYSVISIPAPEVYYPISSGSIGFPNPANENVSIYTTDYNHDDHQNKEWDYEFNGHPASISVREWRSQRLTNESIGGGNYQQYWHIDYSTYIDIYIHIHNTVVELAYYGPSETSQVNKLTIDYGNWDLFDQLVNHAHVDRIIDVYGLDFDYADLLPILDLIAIE